MTNFTSLRSAAAAAVLFCTAAASCAPPRTSLAAEPPVPANCPEILAGEAPAAITPAPPSFDILIIPPDPPRELRGREVLVRLRIDERGRVELPTVRVEGSTDEAYNRKLARSMARYRFRPARLRGCPVAAETAIRLAL